ncbi:hypothetical protein [Deinococcus sp.]|uniref:hypothetical protein n=1 Tax=Deinococcus sp. TaxID=47478 RepID=UPI003CC64B01
MNRPLREWRQIALGLALGLLLPVIPEFFVLHRAGAAATILSLGLLALGWALWLNGRIRREDAQKKSG